MSCIFNKYQNALGVYRVVIDSVLANAFTNDSTFKPSTDLPKLLEYFKDFQYEAEDVGAFTQLALDSVINAYNLVLKELSDQGIVKESKLSTKDANLLTKNFKTQLEKLYAAEPATVPVRILPQDTEETKGSSIAESPNTITVGGVQAVADYNPSLSNWSAEGSIKLKQNVLVDRNLVTKLSDVEYNYYQGSATISRNMLRDLTKNLFDIRILNPLKTNSADSNKTLNEEIRKYKNKLFADMIVPLEQSFPLTDQDKVLYDEFGNVNVTNIENLFKVLGTYYDGYNSGVGVRAYDLASWSLNNKPALDQYNAFVILSNFDTLTNLRSGGTIKVKENYRNLETSADKYVLASTNKMRTGYSSDAIVHADDETTKLFKMFIETIPMVKIGNGQVSSNMFLSTKQVYHTFGKLKNEIDNSDPVGSIERVIVDALTKINDRGGRNLNVTDMNGLLAMYLRIFRNSANDTLIRRSGIKAESLLDAIDSRGDFPLSDSIMSSFSSLHTTGQDINFLDLIAANIAKIDSLSYNEIVFNSATGSYNVRGLNGKSTNRQKGVLRSGIGGSVMNFTKENIDDFLSSNHLKIDGNYVMFNLNGKVLAYNPVIGSFQTRDEEGKVQNLESPSTLFKLPTPDTESADIFQIQETAADFNNYRQIVNTFENVFNQPLSSDNYKLLDLFRSELDGTDQSLQGRHVDVMLGLLGNYAFLANLNSSINNGKASIKNEDIKNMLYLKLNNKAIEYESIWDKGQKRYKIDFNKTGSTALEDYAEVMNNYYGDSIKSVTKNTEGNFVPTVSLMSPINRFKDIISDLATSEDVFSSPLTENYIFKNDGLITGTTIRSGLKNKKGDVISPSRMNTNELLQASILHEFLENKLNNSGSFAIQPTNYADKGKQNLINVNGTAYTNYWDGNKWSKNIQYKNISTNDLANTYFKTLGDQYSRLADKLNDDYAKILDFDDNNVPFVLDSFLRNDTEFLREIDGVTPETKYEDLPEEYKGTDLENELNKLKSIADAIEKFRASNSKTAKLKAIDEIFSNMSGKSINKAFLNAKVDSTKQIYFEQNLNTGKMGINMSLLGELDIYDNPDSVKKERYKKTLEDQFLKSLVAEGFTLDYYDSDGNLNSLLERAIKTYKIGKEFQTQLASHGRLDLADAGGNLNPFLKDYLWNNLLISRNFQFLTVGTPLGHPAKLKKVKGRTTPFTHSEIMASRLVAQNKRMVIHPATMHPYTMNLINGVGFKTRKIFVSDPASTVFNLVGDVDNIDAQDGSSWYLMPAVNMLNVSLLDQKVGLTHKSISGTMNTATGAAGFTKHAGFAITNENIRNSKKLEKIVDSMMSNRFDLFDDLAINVDITKDYNGKHINIGSLIGPVQFNTNHFDERLNQYQFVSNDSMAPVDMRDFRNNVATLQDIENVGPNSYRVTYKVGDSEYSTVATINDYKTLWDLLGGKNSLSYSNDYLGNHPESLLDGFKRSNTSHDALTELINRVGFWYDDGSGYLVGEDTVYRNDDLKTYMDITDMVDPMQYTRIKQYFNKHVHNPNSEADNFSPYVGSKVNQKNIIQPLKLNFQGELTNVSGQKVGAKNVISVSDLENGNISYSYESNLHNGIQLNADHHSDESEVTEQTQIVNTLPFTGDTPEYTDKVFRSINRYINKNLGFLIDTIKDPDFDNKPVAKQEVEDLLKKIIVKTFDDKDVDSLANSLVRVIKNEITSKVKSNLKVPISSPDLYNAVNTAVANFFTKEGIRRKMPGMAAVAKPYAEYIKFKKLPTGETVSTETFNKWRAEHPDTEQYTQFNLNRLNINDTIVDENGKSIVMKDPSTYFRTKLRYSKLSEDQKALWRIDSFADRELASTHHNIIVDGVGSFNYFDFDLILLPHLLEDAVSVQGKLNKIISKLNSGYVLSPAQIAAQGGDLNQQYEQTLAQLQERIAEFNEVREASGMDINPLEIADINKEAVTLSYSGLSKVQKNVLRNSITDFFKKLHNSKQLTSAPYFNRDLDPNTPIEIKTALGEIAMSFPHYSTFGLKPDQDLNEVTESFFLKEINKNSLPLTRKHDLYIKHSDGDHLHILLSGSDAHTELVASGNLYPVTEETVVDKNGKRYSVDALGRQDKLLGYDKLYEAEVDGKLVRYVILNGDNLQEFERLKEMVNSKGSRYDMIVPNFSASVENLPVLLNLATKGVFKANIDHLTRLSALLVSDDTKGLSDFISELDLSTYNDYEGFQELYNSILSGLSQPVVFRNTRKKLLANKAKLEEYFNYIKENNVDLSNPASFSPELMDIVREILHIDLNGWIKRKSKWLADNNLSAVDDVQLALNKLQDNQFKRVAKVNGFKAKARYASFKKSLEVTTARIPGQDKQSYAGMKVVQFFHDEENVIFVPPTFQWTTGGDFDIDKVFTMYFSFGEDGLLSGWSELFDKRDTNFLEESLRLPVPNEELNTDISALIVPVQQGSIEPSKILDLQAFSQGNKPNDYAGQLRQFKNVVDVLNEVDKKGKLFINQSEGFDSINMQVVADYISWYNKESDKKLRDQKGATLNAIFSGVKDSITDIRNMVDAYLPVTFGDYSAKAALSKKGEEMSRMSAENPTDVFRAQTANMIGKEVIGISASSGLKGYSVLSNVMMQVLNGGDGVFMKAFEVPFLENGNIKFKRGTGIHGINFIGNEQKYINYLIKIFNLPRSEAQSIADNLKKRGSLSLDLSAILSAATDNAKELILGRINAGPETVGYYLAASMLGVDVDTIATIMTSDTIESILNLSKRDAFKGTSVNFESALSQIKSKLLRAKDNYFNFNKAINIASALSHYEDEVHEQYIEDRLNEYNGPKPKEYEEKLRNALKMNGLVKSNAFMYIQYIPKVLDINSPKIREDITKSLANHKGVKNINDFTYNTIRMEFTEDMADESIEIMDDYMMDDIFNDYVGEDFIDDSMVDMIAGEDGEVIERRPAPNSVISKEQRNILPYVFNRYLDDYSRLIKSAKVDQDVLKAITTLSKVVNDLNILAKITSVNQRIRNNFLDLKKFIDNIEDYRAENYVKGAYLGSDKSLIDVLGVIDKSPHMRSMLSAATSAFDIYRKTSLKSSMLDHVLTVNELPKDQNTFSKVNQAVEEVIINKFLNDLPNMDSTFLILNGSSMTENNDKTLFTQSVNVKNIEGRMGFIDWFENQVIPDLKKGKLVDFDAQGQVIKSNNEAVKANEFLKRLTVDTGVDYALGGTYRYYRIPIDMLNTKSESEVEILDLLKFNYAKLQGVRYMGKDLTDLFFLYNLIVNKGKVNSVSLNPVISAVTGDYSDSSLASKYVRTIGEYDSLANSDFATKRFLNSDPFMKFLSSKGVGKLEEEVPALGNVVSNKDKFVVVKKYNKAEELVETKTYFADTLNFTYVNTNPSVSSKYLNTPDFTGVGNQLFITEKITEGIKRDKLNKLISGASRRIIDC